MTSFGRANDASPAPGSPPGPPKASCWIYDITSNEDVNGNGDGNTEPDWEIVDEMHVRLRAERSAPGSGREYLIHFRCEDASGNFVLGTVEVDVPHDQAHDN